MRLQRSLASTTYNIAPIETSPNDKLLTQWRENIFRADEIWVIKKIEAFRHFLISNGVSSFYIQEIEAQMVNDLPEDIGHLFSFYIATDLSGSFVKVSNEFKNKLPSSVLRLVYQYLKENIYKQPTLSNESKESLQRTIRSLNLPHYLEKRFSNLIFFSKNKYHFLITPDVLGYLPNELKDQYINIYVGNKEKTARNGLKIEITFSSLTDIHELSEKFGTDLKHKKSIAKLLNKLFKKNQSLPVTIPLEKILPPFIRRYINQFQLERGPNCLNSATCVNHQKNYKQTHTDQLEMMRTLTSEYFEIKNSEELKMGDVLLYRDSMGNIIHAATYIDHNLVFTKNGINKFYPYVFQFQSEMESFYSKHQKLDRSLFRYKILDKKVNQECSKLITVFFD